VKERIARMLFETKAGDAALRAFEKATGLALVEIGEIADVRVAATPKAKAAAAKSRAPARD